MSRPASTKPVRLLLIEDDPLDAEIIIRSLKKAEHEYSVTHCDRLCYGVEKLDSGEFDAVLLDLVLPDSKGLAGLKDLQKVDYKVPIVVCSGANDQKTALHAVKNGAQDYILKEHVEGEHLGRAIQYAIQRKKTESVMEHFAYRDDLTGLPNRLLLRDRLKQAITRAARAGNRIAVFYLDLDNFKVINDQFGHSRGDEVLRAAARVLEDCFRSTDTVARLGGDEFVVVLSDITHQSDVSIAAEKLIDAMTRRFGDAPAEEKVSASIGIALYPGDGKDVDRLLKSADAAMYVAKQLGGGTYQYHSAALAQASSRRFEISAAMGKALEANEYHLHYQPIVNLRTGRVESVEALIRWHSADCGFLSPDEFIPLAEKTRMILPLGEWVIQEACRQRRLWREEGIENVSVAINVSPYQLANGDLPQTLLGAMLDEDLRAEDIRVEVTENGVMVNERRASEALRHLESAGVHVSLDDFGTGFGSLKHLRSFPIDTIKIDRSFVADLESDDAANEIVRGIICLAHGLGKRVVAEGVESTGQLEKLASFGCDEVQGFLFSRPTSPVTAADVMSRPMALVPMAHA